MCAAIARRFIRGGERSLMLRRLITKKAASRKVVSALSRFIRETVGDVSITTAQFREATREPATINKPFAKPAKPGKDERAGSMALGRHKSCFIAIYFSLAAYNAS